MPTEKIAKIGSLLSSWTSIITVVVVFFSGVAGLIYTIKSNSSSIEEIKIVIQDNNKIVKREFEIQANRSDKRYSRAMRTASELKGYIDKVEQRQYDLTKVVYELKGKLNK